MDNLENKKNKKRGLNAWKRYGAVFMAGIMFAGGAAGTASLLTPKTVQAEEKPEVTLNIAGENEDSDQEEET